MKSIDFPQANVAIAKEQTEYNTLYAMGNNTHESTPMIVEFELTDEEIEKIVKNRKVWYSQATFGRMFQPMSIHVDKPFTDPFEDNGGIYPPVVDDNSVSGPEWDSTHFETSGINTVSKFICKNCGRHWNEHIYSTRQCFKNESNSEAK